MPSPERTALDTFPDLGALSDEELKDLIQQLTEEEHGDLLPPPHPARQDRHPARRARQPPAQEARGRRGRHHRRRRAAAHRHPRRQGAGRRTRARRRVAGGRRVALHCPECGFVNADGANYCQKCGAFLGAPSEHDGRARPTATYRIDETGELVPGRPRARSPARAPRSSSAPAAAASARASRSTGERMTIGRSPDADVFLDDVTVSRDHALLVRARRRALPRRPRLAQRHLRQPPPHRLAPARGRRRAADRQVQADLPRALTLATRTQHDARRGEPAAPTAPPRQGDDDRRRLQGARRREFPDISISKIRYLEDQKLLAPRRTPGGYRLYSQRRRRAPAHDPAPAARRVPAAARDPPGARRRAAPRRRSRRGAPRRDDGAPRRRRRLREPARRRSTRSTTWSRRRGADPKLVQELEDYGVIKGERRGGEQLLRRDRARDRPRGHRARPLRRRRAQPARLPHLGRPRGGAARSRSSPRRCARATPSGARRRSRRSRTSRRSRRTSSTCCSCATCARSPS